MDGHFLPVIIDETKTYYLGYNVRNNSGKQLEKKIGKMKSLSKLDKKDRLTQLLVNSGGNNNNNNMTKFEKKRLSAFVTDLEKLEKIKQTTFHHTPQLRLLKMKIAPER